VVEALQGKSAAMRKIVILLLALMVLLAMTTSPVSADVSSDDIIVTVTGDGTWSDGTLSVSLFPGQEKIFTVTVNSTASEDLQVSPVADPSCVGDSLLVVCFAPVNATLVAGGDSVFNLTITAKGNAPPGLFSSNLTINADTEVVDPDPNAGVPASVALMSAQSEDQVVGDSYRLTATIYDSADTPLSGVPVIWSVLEGAPDILSSLEHTTDVNGQAHATATCADVGMSKVRCKVENMDVSDVLELTWVEGDDDNGDGDVNGDVVTTPDIRQPLSAIAFGEVFVDDTLDKTLAVYNDGDAPLVVSSVVRSSGSEDFTYAGPLAPFTIGSAGSTEIIVRFTPTATGETSATFTVTSNDPDTPGVSFTVSGIGKSRGQPAWKVFLIGILIIGGCFGGYIYYKRWKAKREGLDILARSGGEDLGLGVDGDTLDL